MGAFDIYSGEARCPRCGDVHAVEGQTKFFAPDFGGLEGRWFRAWHPQPLDFDVRGLQRERVWEAIWWRVREPGEPGRVDVLADLDDCFGCDCGLLFAVVLRFRVDAGRPPTATLGAIELRDALADDALAVDFASGEGMDGEHARFPGSVAALAAEPTEVRMELVRAALRRRFAAYWAPAVGPEAPGWWTVADDVRCEACGAVRRREETLLLAHTDHPVPFFGPGWTGGRMARGMRFTGDLGWLADDRDRGHYTRLRHPVPEDRLVVLGPRRRAGCGCGAGRGALVLTFTREPGALVLADVAIRVVRGAEDLQGVDFAEAPEVTRDLSRYAAPRRWTWTREAALARVLAELTRP